jgi:hypothetical protein
MDQESKGWFEPHPLLGARFRGERALVPDDDLGSPPDIFQGDCQEVNQTGEGEEED